MAERSAQEPLYRLEFTGRTLAYILQVLGRQPHHEVGSLIQQIGAEVELQDAQRQEAFEAEMRAKYGPQASPEASDAA